MLQLIHHALKSRTGKSKELHHNNFLGGTPLK